MENLSNTGDLVWEKVHPHPGCPGIIYNKSLASTPVNPRRNRNPTVASNDQETSLIEVPADQLSESESHGWKKAKVNCRNKNQVCLGPREDILHATKTEYLVKRNRCNDFNSKSYPDHVSKRKKQAKVKVDEKLHKRKRSSKLTEDDRKVKSSAMIAKFRDVHLAEKVQSSETPTPSKTRHTHHELPPELVPPKKRYRLFVEGWEKPLASPPQIQKKKMEKTISIKTSDEGTKMILIMNFPQGTVLPSPSELKVKFARFGSLDTSSIRRDWDKLSCQMVFENKSNAETAYTHAANNKFFGNLDVRYILCSENSTCDLPVGCNLQQEETCRTPPHAPVRSCNASVYQTECGHQEMCEYQEQMDQTAVLNNKGCVDISEKMLYLLNECYRIVQEQNCR